jgi:simple sugar transport system permease protein
MKFVREHQALLAGAVVLLLLLGAGRLRYGDRGFGSAIMLGGVLDDNAVLGILAVGMTFVILSGGIDLSVGAVMSMSSVFVALAMAQWQWHPVQALPAALAMGTVFGGLMGAAIHFLRMKPFIVTLAGMFLARGLGFLLHLEPIGIDHAAFATLARWNVALGDVTIRLPGVLFLLAIAIAAYILRFRPFGRAVYALGGDEEAALLMGLPVGRTKIATYSLCGLCSSLGGIALALYLSSGSHVEGVGMELDAIAAVVVGGTLLTGGIGGMGGTFVGVLIIGLIFSITTYENLGSGPTRVFIGALLLGSVILQRVLLRSSPRPT